jgi:hypothetical protein
MRRGSRRPVPVRGWSEKSGTRCRWQAARQQARAFKSPAARSPEPTTGRVADRRGDLSVILNEGRKSTPTDFHNADLKRARSGRGFV